MASIFDGYLRCRACLSVLQKRGKEQGLSIKVVAVHPYGGYVQFYVQRNDLRFPPEARGKHVHVPVNELMDFLVARLGFSENTAEKIKSSINWLGRLDVEEYRFLAEASNSDGRSESGFKLAQNLTEVLGLVAEHLKQARV